MKIKNIILLFLLFGAYSCSLDLRPESNWTDKSFFENPNQLNAALYGGYVQLRNALGGGFLIYGSARSDEFYCYNTTKTDIDNIVNNGITPYNPYANWSSFYAAIQQANLVLGHASDMLAKGDITSSDADIVMGQAYCLRAFTYFWIVRIWGACPLILEAQTGSNYDPRKTRVEESLIFEQIHKDLIQAESLLPDNGDRIHFTKTAAYAIEAQVCAWEKNWNGVIVANTHILARNTSSLINNSQYSLAEFYNPSYTQSMTLTSDFYTYITSCEMVKLFNEGGGRESIFELSYSIEDNSTSNTLYGLVGNSEALRSNMKSVFNNLRSSGDWRFFLNFYGNNPRWTKYFVNFTGLSEATRNVVLLRLGEMVLLEVEALANLIETEPVSNKAAMLQTAVDLLNLIRYRAGGTDLEFSIGDFDVNDMETFKAALLHERFLELFGEGYRYFDLIRFGKLLEVMEPVNGQDKIESAVWPIYYTEILYSGGSIEQNTYYK